MPDTHAPITRPAHAKINLCLSVGPAQPSGTVHEGRDVSGYHRIASWMACVELHDDVTITRKAQGEFSTFEIGWATDAPRATTIDWSMADDLAWRALGAIEKKAGRLLPVDLVVTKRIPVGGGFGGGSSDAATVLLLVNELFELGYSHAELRTIGTTLGSDVAYFLDGGEQNHAEDEADDDEVADSDDESEEDDSDSDSDDDDASEDDEDDSSAEDFVPRPALVWSFGEVIERADAVPAEIILVVPSFACSTRTVYQAFDELLAARVADKRLGIAVHKGQEAADSYAAQDARDDLVARRIDKALRASEIDGDTLFNDLFLPAVRVEPRLGRLVTALSKATRTSAHLTGSGSGVFLIVRGSKAPDRTEKLLAKVRKALDTLTAPADDDESDGLAGETFVAIATRLI